MRVITRTGLFLLLIGIALTVQNSENSEDHYHEQHIRDKRAVKKVGPVRSFLRIFLDQWNDTSVTWNRINTMINGQFADESTTKMPTTTGSPNVSTTTEAFKITRTELFRILRRNLKGIARLYNLELRDALKQSDKVSREYSRNVSREVSKFL